MGRMTSHAPPSSAPLPGAGVLADFHPAVRAWFEEPCPEGPTKPQQRGWPEIRAGRYTLVAAPTGSGKTLSGFLVAIDALYRAHDRGEDVTGTTRVVYVSPLKALAVDIHQNLERPLREIEETARGMGLDAPGLTVAVRTGDTPSSARAAMLKVPPSFLITTPESLYLLLTAERSRELLRHVDSLIVDEIRTTAVCPGSADSGSRPGCAPATCAPSSPRRPWSSVSTSVPSSWSARSDRRGASPRSCSASVVRTTHAPARRLAACIRLPVTSCS